MQSSLRYPISSSSLSITSFLVLTSYLQKSGYFFTGAAAGAAAGAGTAAGAATGASTFGPAFLAFLGGSFFISLPAQGLAGAPVAAAGASCFFASSAKLRPATETLKNAVITTIPNFFIIASNHPLPGFDITSMLWLVGYSMILIVCRSSAKMRIPTKMILLNRSHELVAIPAIARRGRKGHTLLFTRFGTWSIPIGVDPIDET